MKPRYFKVLYFFNSFSGDEGYTIEYFLESADDLAKKCIVSTVKASGEECAKKKAEHALTIGNPWESRYRFPTIIAIKEVKNSDEQNPFSFKDVEKYWRSIRR